MDKVYNPKKVEKKWYKFWKDNNFFHSEVDFDKKPFSIVIPPPNVTGNLHMGHALNNTLQDIVIRRKRMQGYLVTWIPGTDHAGIATQNVVERELAKENVSRHELGREEFIKRVWKFKEKYGDVIISQLEALGCSCDWQRQRFTMDEGYSKAVKQVFVRLYDEGLIYRDRYIINWCPKDLTALSDIEVEHAEVEGKLWYIKYPLKDEKGYLEVATTRPETMLGDTAVAVNPKDGRYKSYVGKTVLLPLTGREIPVVKDDFVDPEFGTGAVKVTPAHDPNDFEIGKRHNLESIDIFTDDAKINKNGGAYKGLDRFKAREKIVEDLKKDGQLTKTESHMHSVGHCYRCDTTVEPRLSLQWFVKMKSLAEPAIDVVERGDIKFRPKRWLKIYFEWMENIRDWVISRQIWWGHQLPVYYCKQEENKNEKLKNKKICGEIIVSTDRPDKCPKCGSTNLEQDPDVLDTWFSSALWPFVTMGWPEKTKELEYFYPTSLLSTGFDILFFWVARMIMMGLHFTGDIPFNEVYIHALIKDSKGKKMSKSRGNIIDPLFMIEEYGTDALRFTMAALAVPGRDVFLSEKRIEGNRNFTNKIWNASRFVLNGLDRELLEEEEIQPELADRWIISRLNSLIVELEAYYENYDFNKVAKALYNFFWSEFADWYIELSKPRFYSDDKVSKATVSQVLFQVLEKFLKLAHPIMPFITEEIWQQLPIKDTSIMIAPYPVAQNEKTDKAAEEKIGLIMQITMSIRTMRSELRINPGMNIKAIIKPKNKEVKDVIFRHQEYIKLLAKVEDIVVDEKTKKPAQSATDIIEDGEIYLPLADLLDIEEEKMRLGKQLVHVRNSLDGSNKKLANKEYVKKAPAKVVEKEKDKNKTLAEKKDKLEEQIKILTGA